MMGSIRRGAIISEEECGGYGLGAAVMGGLDAGCLSRVSRGQRGIAVLSPLTVMADKG